MDWDHLAEEEAQKLFAAWVRILNRKAPELSLSLATKHRPGHQATQASDFMVGAFNVCYIVTFEDGFRVLVRYPILGRSRFRVEKTQDELFVMRFISDKTQVPVPTVLGTGYWGSGPYIVTTVVEGTLLSKCLRDPAVQSPRLNPNVSDSDLERAYSGMARVMIELSKPVLSSIGALGWDADSKGWRVVKRPLSLNMNELVLAGNYPPSKFAGHKFQTASEYFQELATHHFLHLKYQRNDAIQDENDCRKKYIARCLFRRITREIPKTPGTFHLYCDDFRPSNVLVSEPDLTVTGVIDWEYTYFAPAEFTYTAPWWLLFESPESWESDLNEFLLRYKPRLQLFLKALRIREDEQIQAGTLRESQRLSGKMARSVDNGMFWFCLAARRSFMFDDIYWAFIDEKYFGPLKSLDDRLSLLTEDEREELDEFVQEKMKQLKEGTLDEHQTLDEIFKA